MTNDTLKAIQNRRSIRKFLPQPLTQAETQALAEAALASPTGMNRQDWLFTFITNQDLIADLNQAAMQTFRETGNEAVIKRIKARHESIFYGTPLLILITQPKDQDGLDAGIAVGVLAVAAQSMGLGSCIIGLADAAFSGSRAAEMARKTGMPEDHRFAISIAIGYPAISKEAHERRPEKIRYII